MPSSDTSTIVAKLQTLRLEHRDLDAAIERLAADLAMDELQLRRLKKRKLAIKDAIAKLESRLIPDLDA
ncbi:MAG: YdcH family protein [Proteobacteria bacterium]|nr:YdcH family protein [Pseudomonadota bacterium]